jgi:hypothetical protein
MQEVAVQRVRRNCLPPAGDGSSSPPPFSSAVLPYPEMQVVKKEARTFLFRGQRYPGCSVPDFEREVASRVLRTRGYHSHLGLQVSRYGPEPLSRPDLYSPRPKTSSPGIRNAPILGGNSFSGTSCMRAGKRPRRLSTMVQELP